MAAEVPRIPPGRFEPAPVQDVAPSPIAQLGFVTLLMFLFVSYSRLIDFRFSYLHLPMITSIFALTIAILSGGIKRAFTSRVGMCLCAFTIWILIAIPFSFWRGGSVHFFRELWSKSFLVFLIIPGLILTIRQCRNAMYTVGWGVLIVSLMALYFKYTIEGGRLGLPDGMLTNPNDVAQVILIALPFWLLMAVSQKSNVFQRILAVGCMLLLLLVLFKTGSRGGLVTLVALCLLTFLRVSSANRLKLFGAVCVIAVVCYPLVPRSLRERYKTVVSENKSDETFIAQESKEERLQLLMMSLKLTARHPLLGLGPGQFETAAADYAKQNHQFAHWRETHNVYTQVSSEEGLPGLLFYVGAIIYCFKELHFVRRQSPKPLPTWNVTHPQQSNSADLGMARELSWMAFCLELSLIAFCVFGCFSSTAYHFFFPTLAGIVVALGALGRQEAARTKVAVRQPLVISDFETRPNHSLQNVVV